MPSVTVNEPAPRAAGFRFTVVRVRVLRETVAVNYFVCSALLSRLVGVKEDRPYTPLRSEEDRILARPVRKRIVGGLVVSDS